MSKKYAVSVQQREIIAILYTSSSGLKVPGLMAPLNAMLYKHLA